MNNNLTENEIRKQLYRDGYKLITTSNIIMYGNRVKKYAIADYNDIIVSGESLDLGDVEDWLNQK